MAKYEIAKDHPFEILTNTYITTGWVDSGRKIHVLNRTTNENVQCILCKKLIVRDPFIGAQYTFDSTEFSPMCIKCSVEREIMKPWPPPPPVELGEEDGEGDDDVEEIKRKRGRPPGSKNKPKLVVEHRTLAEEMELEEDMSLASLKAKMAAKSAGAATPAAAPKAAKTEKTLADLEPKRGDAFANVKRAAAPAMEVDDEDEEMSLEEEPATPASLRAKVDAIDVKKTAPTGITKADVAEVIRMCLAEQAKETDEKFKTLKTDISKKISDIKDELVKQSDEAAKAIAAMSASFNELVAILGGGEEEDSPAVEAEPEPEPAPAPPAKKAKAAPAPAPTPAPAPAPAGKKPPFADFVAEQAGGDGINITVLGDLACEMGYFNTAPEDPDVRDQSLVSLLMKPKFNGRFSVSEDGLVTVNN